MSTQYMCFSAGNRFRPYARGVLAFGSPSASSPSTSSGTGTVVLYFLIFLVFALAERKNQKGEYDKHQGKHRLLGFTRSSRAWSLRLARLGIAEHRFRPGGWRGPARGVGDHPPDLGVEVGRVALVAGAEVEDLAAPTRVAAAAAKHLAALEPAHEHQRLGRRDVEALAVHLLGAHLDALAQALGD